MKFYLSKFLFTFNQLTKLIFEVFLSIVGKYLSNEKKRKLLIKF